MSAVDEIKAMYGMFPLILRRIDEAGDLEEQWPFIRSVWMNPAPLPSAVLNSLMAVLGLRCREDYCFVVHSMYLATEGAEPEAVEQLGRYFTVPAFVPDADRWSRVVGLAWIADGKGPQADVARHALELEVTPDELGKIDDACRMAEMLIGYISRYDIRLEDENGLAMLPESVRALMPEFIEFHMRLRESDPGERPVATTCASCLKVRATTDRNWYPRDAVTKVLPEDVLYSHGLCEPCADQYSVQVGA